MMMNSIDMLVATRGAKRTTWSLKRSGFVLQGQSRDCPSPHGWWAASLEVHHRDAGRVTHGGTGWWWGFGLTSHRETPIMNTISWFNKVWNMFRIMFAYDYWNNYLTSNSHDHVSNMNIWYDGTCKILSIINWSNTRNRVANVDLSLIHL